MRTKSRMVAAGLLSLVATIGGVEPGWAGRAARYVEHHHDVPFVHDCHGIRPHHDECP
jgi:hypothetical protein